MTIQDIMTATLERIETGATLSEAAMLMDKHDVGCLAVVQDGDVVGTTTDRDIVIRALAAEKDPETTSVREAMTTDPVFCHKEDTVETVAERMREQRIRRLIVEDENGIPVGMISVGDIAARAHGTEMTGTVLKDLCSTP
ncbi:MAG: CBS domain-containing protein [Planctomycetes bacterium]|jgi:CBS domain-containing protein|nr:CBS domain-containing protein [Phycisphaerae bacterium]NBB95724.1 CBS domain-containing protein [Planctomycetota bacterium]